LLELDVSDESTHQNKRLEENSESKRQFPSIKLDKEFLKKNLKHLPLIAIIIGSIIARIFAAVTAEGFIHPDEVFQTIEMIHYRIFGQYGWGQTIPWTNPLNLILSARIFLSLFSIMTVLTSYYFGREAFNKPVGLITAFLVGFWWFFPFWASRTMTDSISSDLLFLSIFLAYRCIKKIKQPKKRFTTVLSQVF